MVKKIAVLLLLAAGLGCQQPNKPVPAAHTDTFILYPASDSVVAIPQIVTDSSAADTLPTDSSGQQAPLN